jgi:hypothetical protein
VILLGANVEESRPARIDPTPTDGEAAAILAALAAFLADEAALRAAHSSAIPAERRWAQAGRLASQGSSFTRGGVRNSWGTAARLARIGRSPSR